MEVKSVEEMDQVQEHLRRCTKIVAECHREALANGLPARIAEGMTIELTRKLMDLPTPAINNNYFAGNSP